jgi:hypothetical protein
MDILPEDVINIILNKLSVKDLIFTMSINKKFSEYKFNYREYLHWQDLTDINVDKDFMKHHGQYLANICRVDMKQWLYFFDTMLEINKKTLKYNSCKFWIGVDVYNTLINDCVTNIYISNENGKICESMLLYGMFNTPVRPVKSLLDNLINTIANYKIKSILLHIIDEHIEIINQKTI